MEKDTKELSFDEFQIYFSTGNYISWTFSLDKQLAVLLLRIRPHSGVRKVEQTSEAVYVVKV
jgi:hypothetical protein